MTVLANDHHPSKAWSDRQRHSMVQPARPGDKLSGLYSFRQASEVAFGDQNKGIYANPFARENHHSQEDDDIQTLEFDRATRNMYILKVKNIGHRQASPPVPMLSKQTEPPPSITSANIASELVP
jgi:hypothetical protein